MENSIDIIRNWTSRNCPSEEELTRRSHVMEEALAASTSGIYSDASVRENLPLTIRQDDCRSPLEFCFIMGIMGRKYAGTDLTVVYAKPEQKDGSVVPQITIKIREEKR